MLIIRDKQHADHILQYAIKECNKYYSYEVLVNRIMEMELYIHSFLRYGYIFHAKILRIWVRLMKANYRKKRKVEYEKLKVKNVPINLEKIKLHDFLEGK
jgi:hypothetical protein